MTRARRISIAVFGTAAMVVAAGWFLAVPDSVRSDEVWQRLSWRARLYNRKAIGRVPELSWNELWYMTRRPGGFGLEDVVRFERSLAGSVVNLHTTADDRAVGARIFHEQCAACHGADGSGWQATPLNRQGLKHGDSDLAVYKVLRDGIPGTTMVPTELSLPELWQLVGFVRALRSGAGSSHDTSRPEIQISREEIASAGSRSDQWLTYSGSLDGRRYSSLDEITRENVSRLRIRWTQQFETDDSTIEATPLVANGVIFTTYPPSNVVALDASTATVIWKYTRALPDDLPLCCRRMNRGLAMLGNVVFYGSLDGYLIAIDADDGRVLWETQVASPAEGFTLTGAPLIANGLVIVGVAGGEFGIRGFLAAYDSATGKQRWRFSTIPGPGEFGHQTWQNDAWQTGGGPTWVTGSYDASLDLIYWGVGNPGPVFAGHVRPGDNLFTNSVIALHASSGKLAWHFQFTPHDVHDWDSNQTPILTDLVVDGISRKVICWANRNGFYYVLDRVTGAFLTGVPYVEVDWAKSLDSSGRPVLSDANRLSESGRATRPGAGGTNWQNPALDRTRGLLFVPATESASVFTSAPKVGRGLNGAFVGSTGQLFGPIIPVVRALEATTGKRAWEYFSPQTDPTLSYSGLLATGGGLVFGASGGSLFAIDSDNGRELWRVFLGGDTRAAPISFTVDGRQVVAVSAGRALFVFGL